MKGHDDTRAGSVIRLHVLRGLGDGESHTSDYEIPVGEAASLLDGLRWVRENLDESLAFRYSCINANACKECMMHFDGKTVYACVARLQDGADHQVAPLPNKSRIRDLISEVSPSKERLFAGRDDDEA